MQIFELSVAKLTADPNNARKHDAKNIAAIVGSLKAFGQQKPIVVDKSDTVVAGNGTLEAARSLGWETIQVVYTDLLGQEATAYALADNRTAELAAWDDDVLSRTLEKLKAEIDLEALGFDKSFFNHGPGETDVEYTTKITLPLYEPKGDCPTLGSLVDTGKTEALLHEIQTADLPDEIKAFLKMAAHRHRVFNYERIAEYYSHAPQEVQALMEKSALVIIDFNDAIKNGFVKLSRSLTQAYVDEQDCDDGQD